VVAREKAANTEKQNLESSSLSVQMSLLARSVLRAASQQPAVVVPAQARNMATLREIELRLKSVKNIEKITKVCRYALAAITRLTVD
jgi:hypothetical protein